MGCEGEKEGDVRERREIKNITIELPLLNSILRGTNHRLNSGVILVFLPSSSWVRSLYYFTVSKILGVFETAEQDEMVVKSNVELKNAEIDEGYTMDVVVARQLLKRVFPTYFHCYFSLTVFMDKKPQDNHRSTVFSEHLQEVFWLPGGWGRLPVGGRLATC
ncbi:hypothetical protein H6P81_006776 [Aristolochia fimbriata]|uniref:Uncharacterized protein n=1 Tax=Aristolochia fimbriata TaxID=158543 RepID=A0AAV7F250_ARIFI|nr:hypothetical protein H6P81_006776 [Aristolochia fimbriata]